MTVLTLYIVRSRYETATDRLVEVWRNEGWSTDEILERIAAVTSHECFGVKAFWTC